MKTVFLIIVFLHGLLHLLGFVKALGLREVRELTLHISKPMGLAWLIASLFFLIYGILYGLNSRFAWGAGLVAVVLSQILVIMFWQDAKFGTLPNLLILLVVMVSFGHYNFQQRIQQETSQLLSQSLSTENKIISESDLRELPEPVQNWLRQSGAVGKPLTSLGKVTQKAEMKMQPGQKKWWPAEAIQYTVVHNPAFVWSVDVKMNSLLHFQGRDKFKNGKGEMLIKMNSLINVVDEQGEKLDEGSLQRYLGEMVWFPSLALSPFINWEVINDSVAKATMRYQGTSGSGTFFFNEHAEVTKFSAWRYQGNKTEAKRHRWVIKILDYKTFDGLKVPSKMTSTWKLDQGDWTWLKLEVTDIQYNGNVSR